MTALLRGELLKLRTTRTFLVLLGLAVALSLVIVILVATLGEDFSKDDVRELFSFDLSSLFILLLGVIGMAGEWRHRTITSTILAAPDRLRLLGAKVIAFAAAGAVVSLIVSVAIMAVGSLILSGRGETTLGIGGMADLLWRNLVIAALLGAVGVCIGGVVRNQLIAIIGLLILLFVVEPTLLAVAPEVGRFGPLIGAPNGILGGLGDDDLFAPALALLVMVGWVAIGFVANVVRLHDNDLV